MLPFTRAGGELIVPYAVELGIKVEEQRDGRRSLVGLSFRDDYVIFEEHDLLTTTYFITSSVDRAAEVTIEHSRLANYDVVAPRTPDEESAGFARWRVPCAPQARVDVAVTERQLTSRSELVRNLNGARLQEFLRDKLLDKATVKALDAILALYRQAAEAQSQLRKLDQEREAIYKQQRQVQGNLQPLGREGEEGALRQRYVASLGQLEDRLAAIAAEEARLREQIASLESQAAEALKGLKPDQQ